MEVALLRGEDFSADQVAGTGEQPGKQGFPCLGQEPGRSSHSSFGDFLMTLCHYSLSGFSIFTGHFSKFALVSAFLKDHTQNALGTRIGMSLLIC